MPKEKKQKQKNPELGQGPTDLGPGQNSTSVTEFILLGLTEHRELKPILFTIFLLAYVATVGGNLSLLAAILVESKLHTPMYFFLGNLSFLDIGCITVTVPPMLEQLLSQDHSVSFASCFSQLFFFHCCRGIQGSLIGICWTISFCNALTHTVALSVLNFCGPNLINHFFCDVQQLFGLSCSSTSLNERLLFVGAAFMGVVPLVLISISCAHVAAAVLRIRSAEGRKKAFSTCSSHLAIVGIFYGTGLFSYMRLGSVETSDKDKGIGILNTVLSPMLNPLIYSLRNPDVQGALRRVFMGQRPME
uniref:G-protein coupled receptors family 1 profile domain-containing protein n=1 Tax=Vombatus ursinus TaxID=29139 RepID=A0A4X2M9A4_VOMUR